MTVINRDGMRGMEEICGSSAFISIYLFYND